MIRREESSEDLLTAAEAALILSRNSKRDIRPQYVNQLVRQKRITPHRLDARTNLYRRGDVEQIVIAPRGGKHIQNHSKRKPKRKDAASEEAA
jgi:hypothetical protein